MSFKKLGIALSILLVVGITGICLADNQPGPPPDPAQMVSRMKSGLDKLVQDKVITQTQEDAVIQYFNDHRPQGGPSPQEKGEMGQSRPDPLNDLIKNGVITQEQAQAIQKIFPKPPAPRN